MLRSRSLRQSDPWIPSQRLDYLNTLPIAESSESDTVGASDSRRASVRRGQSYSSRKRCWTSERRCKAVTVLAVFVLWLVLVGLWFFSIFKPGLRSLPSSLVSLSPLLKKLPPSIRELKRQNPTSIPKEGVKARPVVGRKTLLDLGEEDEHDIPEVKHDMVNLRWPPLVTTIPEIRPSPEALRSGLTSQSVDAQFCQGGPHCRFLFPLWIGEQESRGRMHLMQVVHLAASLNRTLVLPNVGKSRIGGCGKWAFDAYYDVPSFARQVQDLYGAPGRTMTMDDFKTWVDMRPDNPVAQMVFLDENSTAVNSDFSLTTLVASEDALEVHVDTEAMDYDDPRLKNARCLKSKLQKLNLEKRYPISMRLASGNPPGAVVPGTQLAAVLQRDDVVHASMHRDLQDIPFLQGVLAPDNDSLPREEAWEDADVILLHWDLRHFPFAILPLSERLDYSPNIHRLMEKLTEPYAPYVAVHWRMETVPPALLPDCAEALVDTLSIILADPTLSQDVHSIWLATDLPWTSSPSPQLTPVQRSNTFRNITSQHTEAVEIVHAAFDNDGPLNGWKLTGLAQEMKRVQTELGASGEDFVLEDDDENGLLWEDSGVWGILDKMVAMESALFVSGARGCGRVSSFTRQIVDFRTEGRGRTIPRNVVELFG